MPLSLTIRRYAGAVAVALAGIAVSAQAPVEEADRDTLRHVEMDDVVVSATRSARVLEDVPVPVTVMTGDEIQARGSMRLADILSEQLGLIVSTGLGGDGLQVQGFDSDYTLILIDGEPVVGRTGGTLDLNRLAVTGVERVEIVRGPLSARYGSDALAGVVNIITRRPGYGVRGSGMFTYEDQGTNDFSVDADFGNDRWGVRLFLNRYGSDGHSIQPELGTTSVPEHSDYSAELRARYEASANTDVELRLRGAFQAQENRFLQGTDLYREQADRNDYSINPSLRHRFSSSLSLNASIYGARFENEVLTLEHTSGDLFDETSFTHDYGKADINLSWIPSQKHMLTGGGGVISERVGGARYEVSPTASQPYAYAEYSWMPTSAIDLVVSGRFDSPSDYEARLTPNAALLVRALDWLRIRASVGSGYKAPDFRQRYLSFTNGTVGYSVFGAQEAREELAALDAEGGIDRFLLDPTTLGSLDAESSTAFGIGFEAGPVTGLVLKVNGFHNEVRNLIDTQPIAVKTNGQQVFSYFNLNRIYTRGIEAEVTGRVLNSESAGLLTLGVGYQFLDTADRDVLDLIDEGRLFRRNNEGRDERVPRSDYGGLLGRSRHSATFHLTHTLSRLGLTTSARATWRSRYGFQDINANQVVDVDDEYAPAYALVHLTVTKSFGKADLRTGVRNLFNHIDPAHLPSETGRVFFAGAGYRF